MTVTYSMMFCGGGHQSGDVARYRGRIEKVKFGVPIQEAFSHDIPATLLVLLLKVNKEGPLKKDIWRAPGNAAHVRKLSQIMQHGRLVNIANFSVYTAASVVKKFLSKLPGGIFGVANEERLFTIVEQEDPEKQRDAFCRIISVLPVPAQHLLVLLFGTFRLIADAAESCGSRMSPEAIGVCVAPSLFHTCIHHGQRAKIEDVVRFRIASEVVTIIIKNFGYSNLVPRENYEFYARITGRTLRLDENWLFTFQYPANLHWLLPPPQSSQQQQQKTSGSLVLTPRLDSGEGGSATLPRSSTQHQQQQQQQHPPYDRDAAQSVGDELQQHHNRQQQQQSERPQHRYEKHQQPRPSTSGIQSMYDDDLKRANQMAESTRSLTYLEWVHEKQTQRLQSRSDWFLTPELNSTDALIMHQSTRSEECFASVTTPVKTQSPVAGGGVACSSQSAPTPSQQPSVVCRKRSWRNRYTRPKQPTAPRPSLPDASSSTADSIEAAEVASSSAAPPVTPVRAWYPQPRL